MFFWELELSLLRKCLHHYSQKKIQHKKWTDNNSYWEIKNCHITFRVHVIIHDESPTFQWYQSKNRKHGRSNIIESEKPILNIGPVPDLILFKIDTSFMECMAICILIACIYSTTESVLTIIYRPLSVYWMGCEPTSLIKIFIK